MWKDYFYFTRGERKGIIILIISIVSVIGFNFYLSQTEVETDNVSDEELETCKEFIASVREKEQSKRTNRYHKEEREIVLVPFDPNIADSATFVRLGLRPYIAHNILRYRAKGGKFPTPEAFAKIYGIEEEQFRALSPYIIIGEEFQFRKDTFRLHASIETKDTPKLFKYPKGTVIDLNEADTTELKKIPGIGSGTAARIVYYRKKLGGFYKVTQLQELSHVSDSLNHWFKIKNIPIHRINLNKANVEKLCAHPYINFYQAKVIAEYKKKKGGLKSLKQLALYEEFTAKDMERLEHYVCFDEEQ